MGDMKASWDSTLKGNGMEVFNKLLTGPDGEKIRTKYFPTMGDLNSDKGKSHVSNVFNGIQKMIDAHGKPEMDALKKEFIQKHKQRGVGPSDIDRMKDAFGAVLDGGNCGPGAKQAWADFLDELKKSL